MNTHSLGKSPAALLLTSNAVVDADPSETDSVVVACASCDLVGGSFPPAEAAYLQAIHNRVHHGWSFAAAA